MRPAALPESTSETVDWETPARRATSILVTRGGALIAASYGPRGGSRRRSRRSRWARPRPAAAAQPRGAARRRRRSRATSSCPTGPSCGRPAWRWRAWWACARCAARGCSSSAAGSGCRRWPRPRRAVACSPPTGREESIALAVRNADRNGLTVEALCCSWTAPEPLLARAPWELVLASDVLYEERNGEALLPAAAAPDRRARRDLARRPGPPDRRPVPGGGARAVFAIETAASPSWPRGGPPPPPERL